MNDNILWGQMKPQTIPNMGVIYQKAFSICVCSSKYLVRLVSTSLLRLGLVWWHVKGTLGFAECH